MKPVQILIADDHEVTRRGVRAVLEECPRWEVVGEAANGREAIEQARQLKPDLIIMDISMPELNGLDATRQILQTAPKIEVLILTLHDSEQLMRLVLASGARGFILKSDASRDLLGAVEALSNHRLFFTHKMSELVLEGFLRVDPPSGRDESVECLTTREREIVQLLAEGKSNKEIAEKLRISVKTVETHRGNITTKLHLGSLSDLIRYAIRNHIVEC